MNYDEKAYITLMGTTIFAVILGLFLSPLWVSLVCAPGMILFFYYMARLIAEDIKEWREIRCSKD